MVNKRAVSCALGIWALSCIPAATATLIWNVCTTDAAGVKTCRLSVSAQVRIAITCVFVLLMLLCLVICIIQKRRAAAAASEQEYNVEASQVEGPPTIIGTEYNPTSGPSGVYGGPKSGFKSGQTSAEMTGPTYPVAAQVYNRTAPVTQTTFPDQPYPFTGYSSNMGPAPQTAFVSGGFPRALLAGSRLKEKLKERPASASQTTFGS